MKIFIKIAIYLVLATLVTAVVMPFPMHRFESNLYDFLYVLKPTQSPDKQIVLIAVDKKSIDQLNHNWPLPLKNYNKAISNILSGNPKLIALGNHFWNNPTTSQAEKEFIANFNQSNKIVTASSLKSSTDFYKHMPYVTQKEKFHNLVHIDSTVGALDNVSREHSIRYYSKYSFETAIAKKLGYIDSFESLPNQIYTNYLGPKNTFKTLSFIDVYNGKIKPSYFENKIVIIRRTTNDSRRNFELTPTDKALYSFTKLEIHGTVLHNIINKTYLTKASNSILAIITFIASLVSIVLTMEIAPILGLISLIISIAVFYGFSFLALVYNNMWLQSFHPLLVIFISYYILIPYRLLKETRKRVAMEKEHEAFTKVEKFKTNFISLMSHDLKTPIASIQGTAEVLSHENSGLPDKVRTSLKDNIVKRSEDLLKFVNNILDVAKVESENISLNMESKDINNIIEKCVSDLSYLAKAKDIEVRSELEPLFPIKVDVALMRQVISTLIENAIKYSPEGSRIALRSSDYNDTFLEIKVSDNGPGIPKKERDLIFTKFYRGNNTRTNPVKGTGLGLYLAKYFVELHKGRIAINSAKAGSTFSVLLPLS